MESYCSYRADKFPRRTNSNSNSDSTQLPNMFPAKVYYRLNPKPNWSKSKSPPPKGDLACGSSPQFPCCLYISQSIISASHYLLAGAMPVSGWDRTTMDSEVHPSLVLIHARPIGVIPFIPFLKAVHFRNVLLQG